MSGRKHRITLVMPDREVVIEASGEETILEAALAYGYELPNLCCQGWCTTCAARLVEGTLDHSAALRYFEQDREAGFALLCSAKPRSDCRIVTHQKAAIRDFRDRHNLPSPKG